MELNRSGKLARFYLFFGDAYDLPEDFCTFFWGLVGRLLKLLVATAIGIVVIIAIVAVAVNLGVGAWRHPKIAAFVIGLAIGIVAILWRGKHSEVYSEVHEVIETKFDSIKNRYCPRIDWK